MKNQCWSVEKKVTHFNQCTNNSKKDNHLPKTRSFSFVKQAISVGIEPSNLVYSTMTSKCKINIGQWTLNSHILFNVPISPLNTKTHVNQSSPGLSNNQSQLGSVHRMLGQLKVCCGNKNNTSKTKG